MIKNVQTVFPLFFFLNRTSLAKIRAISGLALDIFSLRRFPRCLTTVEFEL